MQALIVFNSSKEERFTSSTYYDVEEEVELLESVIASIDEVMGSNGEKVINVGLESTEGFSGMCG